MSDASAELQDFQSLLFACSAFLRIADEASNKKDLDQFQGLGNYLIQDKEPAVVLSSIDRTPGRIGKDDTLVALLSKGRICGYMSGIQESRAEQGVEQVQVNSQTLSDTVPVLVADDKSLFGMDESIAASPVFLVIRMDNDNCGLQTKTGYHFIELDGDIVLHG